MVCLQLAPEQKPNRFLTRLSLLETLMWIQIWHNSPAPCAFVSCFSSETNRFCHRRTVFAGWDSQWVCQCMKLYFILVFSFLLPAFSSSALFLLHLISRFSFSFVCSFHPPYSSSFVPTSFSVPPSFLPPGPLLSFCVFGPLRIYSLISECIHAQMPSHAHELRWAQWGHFRRDKSHEWERFGHHDTHARTCVRTHVLRHI